MYLKSQRRRQRQGQHRQQGHRHRQRQRRQDNTWEVAGIVLAVPYIIRRLRSSTAIYYIKCSSPVNKCYKLLHVLEPHCNKRQFSLPSLFVLSATFLLCPAWSAACLSPDQGSKMYA
jgi:hypothetical protein